jgi:hypothetical protein
LAPVCVSRTAGSGHTNEIRPRLHRTKVGSTRGPTTPTRPMPDLVVATRAITLAYNEFRGSTTGTGMGSSISSCQCRLGSNRETRADTGVTTDLVGRVRFGSAVTRAAHGQMRSISIGHFVGQTSVPAPGLPLTDHLHATRADSCRCRPL